MYKRFAGGWMADSKTTNKQFIRCTVDDRSKLFLATGGKVYEISLFQIYHDENVKDKRPPFSLMAAVDEKTEISIDDAVRKITATIV